MHVNRITGLKESTHNFYGIPLVHQKNINALRLNGQKKAVHNVPIENDISFDFYSSLDKSEELIVIFHGANSDHNNFYPRYERVRTFQNLAKSFINVADPTIQMGIKDDMRLSWYLGSSNFDPLHVLAKVIRKAQGRTGAKHVAFIGGSGGGFAALRASAMWPGSLAFIQDPQTILENYSTRIVRKYFETVWPGWNRASLLKAFPERFDMVRYYAQYQPNNFIYYAQNSSDEHHVQQHYAPFAEVHGMSGKTGLNAINNRYFSLYDGENSGHGKITHEEFIYHYDSAMQFWRNSRKDKGF